MRISLSLAFLLAWSTAHAQPSPSLVQKELNALIDDLGSYHQPSRGPLPKPEQNLKFKRLKDLVSDFIIGQLDADPGMSAPELRSRLVPLLPNEVSGDERNPAPYVFAAPDLGPRSKVRHWAVAYAIWFGLHGLGGTGVVIDSYTWEDGNTRLSGRGGGELSGHVLVVDQLAASPDKLLLLASGILAGSNGQPSGRAVLYSADATGVRTIWQTPLVAGFQAHGHDDLITVQYELIDRRWTDLPGEVLEAWQPNEADPPRLLVRKVHK